MFQANVYNQPAPGVEGAPASANPRISFVTGPLGLVAGALGVLVGRFAWATDQSGGGQRVDNNAALVANGVSRVTSGFVSNDQQGLTYTWLAESGMLIPPAVNMGLDTRGDFWVKANVAGAARPQVAFANLQDGTMQAGTAGATISASAITASFATNVMTVTVTSGVILPGAAVGGTGVPANTYVLPYGTSGTTGVGGTGTYALSTSPGTVGSAAGIVASNYVETRFKVLSTALVNEICKIGFGD